MTDDDVTSLKLCSMPASERETGLGNRVTGIGNSLSGNQVRVSSHGSNGAFEEGARRGGVGDQVGPREVEGRGEEGRVPLDGGVGRERVGKVAGGREGLSIITDWEKEGRELALPRLALHTTL